MAPYYIFLVFLVNFNHIKQSLNVLCSPTEDKTNTKKYDLNLNPNVITFIHCNCNMYTYTVQNILARNNSTKSVQHNKLKKVKTTAVAGKKTNDSQRKLPFL